MPEPSTRNCIFCGVGKLTREHEWAQWLHPYLKTGEMGFVRSELRDNTTGQLHYDRIYPGSILDKTLKTVCSACNNGWMSRLQTRAKPYIIALLKDEDIILDAEAQGIVASWAVMFSIVAYTRSGNDLIPFLERITFSETQRPNMNWRAWIGRYHGTMSAPQRYIISFGIENDYGPLEPRGQTKFVQTTIILGHCIIQTLFVDPHELYIDHIFYGVLQMLLPLAAWSVPRLRRSSICVTDKHLPHVIHFLSQQVGNEMGDRLDKKLIYEG